MGCFKNSLHIFQNFTLSQGTFAVKNSTVKMFDEAAFAVSYLKYCRIHV